MLEKEGNHVNVISANLGDEKKEYGFYKIQYEGMEPVKSITIGDGSVLISGIALDSDGFASVAFSCDKGRGVGVSEDVPEGTLLKDYMGVDFMLRFDNPLSVDVLMEKLVDCKKYLLKTE